MLRYQSKDKEAAKRPTDMTAPDVSSRIQQLKKRNAPGSASLTAEFNMTFEDRSFSTPLRAAVFNDTWEGRGNGHQRDTSNLAAETANTGKTLVLASTKTAIKKQALFDT